MEGNRLVNVVGWYGKNNIGDEAYKTAFCELWPETNFVFSDEPVEADYHILGGGDVISPTFVNKLKSPFSVMSVAMPSHADAKSLSRADRIWVRDQVSLDNANNLGLKAELVPDFAFALDPKPADGLVKLKASFRKEDLELYSKKIAVIVNSHVSATHNSLAWKYIQFERFTWDLANVADNFSASFVFMPFGTSFPWDDRTAAAAVASKCKFWKKNQIMYDRMSVQDTLNVISACDACISMRLHSSIFATIGATPFVDITHNHKNPNYLETIKRSDWGIPYQSFCKSTLKSELTKRVEANREESIKLQETYHEQREQLRRRANSISFL
jgi:polysaccharide pyruvyl transferase WcaK-like protein